MSTFINPFLSQHVDMLWAALIPEYGREVDYWLAGNQALSHPVTVIWKEGVEDEDSSPGRYSHALIRNLDLLADPMKGDVIDKEGVIYDVVRVNAYAYQYSTIILQERG
jgi:hypothetical protein